MTTDEQASVQRLAPSRTEPARRVERARILWLGRQGQRVPAMATALRLSETTVRQWLQRFHAPGGAGLRDQPRAGRPPTYTTEEGGAVIALSLTNPRRWGLPFASWTLDRRAA